MQFLAFIREIHFETTTCSRHGKHRGGGGGTLIFSYINRLRSFLGGFKILNFNILGGFQEN